MKNKKSIIILSLIAIVGIVGVTVAYFSDSYSFSNEFKTKEYGTTVKEKFISPEAWTPGTTTEKKLKVKNSGTIDEAVRVSYSESWVNKNGDELPLKQGDNVVAIINWTNQRDWIQDGNTFYYKYVLAPQEETSTLIDSVMYNIAVESEISCTETTEGNVKSKTCSSSGEGYDDATYTLTFTIETVQFNEYADAWGTNVVLLDEKPQTVAEYLAENATNVANAEYNNDTKGKMFTFSHTVNGNTINESRYIGDEPKNYVYFNCDDMSNQTASTCEVWRILGVFDVNDGTGNIEQRIKLVRGSDLATEMAWNNGSNINDWTDNNASLKNFLNGDYYNRTGNAATYGLKASARSIIGNAEYYLGAYQQMSHSTELLYAWERENTPCYHCDSDVTKTMWTGIVGLMYPSDEYMVYGNGVNYRCYTSPNNCNGTNAKAGWVYNSNVLEGQTDPTHTWFLSPSVDSYPVLYASRSGATYAYYFNGLLGVRPVVYLKTDIQIVDGDGSSGNPYKLQEI